MILTKWAIKYFGLLGSKVLKAMAQYDSTVPYYIPDDPVINIYEAIRKVWVSRSPVKKICDIYGISRTYYYEMESRFVSYGVAGLFLIPKGTKNLPDMETLVTLVKRCRPSLTNIALHRLVSVVPGVSEVSNVRLIGKIVTSHGYGFAAMETDPSFWGRIQRCFYEIQTLEERPLPKRDSGNRKKDFFLNKDFYQIKLELLRDLFFNNKYKPRELCIQYNIPVSSYYRLIADYRYFGPWAILNSHKYGKSSSVSDELQLKIIIEKLAHPKWSGQMIVDTFKLKCSRHVVNRVIQRWDLEDKTRPPIALNHFIVKEEQSRLDTDSIKRKTAYNMIEEEFILRTQRINRHFQIIYRKMKTNLYHICDPGPFILAPFLNELGIVQAFQAYGPAKLRGNEISNLALFNVFRILAGYKRINHLSNNRDRSVALASGLGMFGSCSKFYEDTIAFEFEHIHNMKLDLVSRAKELGLIDGCKLAFDFHFKEFYGHHAEDNNIGKGPDKSKKMVPGFRPHVAWDLASNVIVAIAYYQGATRSPKIMKSFFEKYICTIIDPRAIKEIYMDSEYTKEADFHYLTEVTAKNGEIFACLKKNKQLEKLIQPVLDDENGWTQSKEDSEDEYKLHSVILPHTGLNLRIVIIRDRKSGERIRLFGSTNTSLSTEDILRKYRYRWIIENGIKDLVYSYFIDEIFGKDPQRIDFSFYCIMVARLAYEYFLKEMGEKYITKDDGNKFTLGAMRKLLFEKRNCTIEQNSDGDLIVTFLDTEDDIHFNKVATLLKKMKEDGRNRVLWWGGRGVLLQAKSQFLY